MDFFEQQERARRQTKWLLAYFAAAVVMVVVLTYFIFASCVLLAWAQTVAADGQVLYREAELLRAIADALDCPVPPFIEALGNQPAA